MPDPAKKLYVVTLEVETLVYAASPEEARKLGREGIREDVVNYGAEDCRAHEHAPGSALPLDWEDDLYPWGSEDRTVREILDAGKAGGGA